MIVRALFVSDVHIWRSDARPDRLWRLLDAMRPSKLYLVGDLFDRWVAPNAGLGSVVRTLSRLREAVSGGVCYPIGNHDAEIPAMLGLCRLPGRSALTGVEIARETIHQTEAGDEYLVMHGDRFDAWMKYGSLSIVAARLANWFRRKHWSLAAYLMDRGERAASDLAAFENAARGRARRRKLAGIVCGHTHYAQSTTETQRHGEQQFAGLTESAVLSDLRASVVNPVQYWNCGTLLGDRPTYIVEQDGALHLRRL